MNNYQELTSSIFKEIIDKYGFESVKINENSIALVGNKFDSNDRVGIGNPVTINDISIAELRISAKGLVNHWQSILNGDKTWISEYESYELGGKVEMVNSVIKTVLEPLFNKK